MKLTQLKNKDGFWWSFASVLSAVPWFVTLYFRFDLTEGTTILLATIYVLLAGMVVGFLRPNRPWRWGIATVLLIPVIDIVMVAVGTIEMAEPNFSLLGLLVYLLVKIPVYALIAIPALLGAYIGSFSRRGLPNLGESRKIILYWGVALVLGILVSAVPYPSPEVERELFEYAPFTTWMVGLLLSACVMGMVQPSRVWRWGVAVGMGLPVVFMVNIIIEATRDPTSGSLWPIALFFIIVISSVAAFAGAYAGMGIVRIFGKFVN